MNEMNEMNNSSDSTLIKSIKVLDIAYIAALYATFCIVISVLIDSAIGKFDVVVESKKSTLRLMIEIYLNIALLAVAGYFSRNLVELFPFPLDGVSGFEHKRVKELGGGIIAGFALFFYQYNLREKIDFVINKIKSN